MVRRYNHWILVEDTSRHIRIFSKSFNLLLLKRRVAYSGIGALAGDAFDREYAFRVILRWAVISPGDNLPVTEELKVHSFKV